MLRDYVALFGAGVASFLAPCLVPLLPAYLGIIVGESVDAQDISKVVPATMVFIFGFATVFVAFGVAAGLVGGSLDPAERTVQRAGGAVIIVLGLALLGVVRGPLARNRRLISKLPQIAGPVRPFIVGVAFGAAWSPCVGPLLGAALVIAASALSVIVGGVASTT